MVLIVCHHYAVHGGFNSMEAGFRLNKYVVQVLSYGGKLGVNIFVLISGYFLVTSGFKLKKAVKLWVQVTFYSLAIAAVFYVAGWESGIKPIIRAALPICYSVYWFATSYFVMYILSNYINKLIYAITREQLKRLIFLLTVILSILPTFFASYMASSNLSWFLFLYLIAAYIRLYKPRIFDSKFCLPIGIGMYVLCLISCLIFDMIGKYIPLFDHYSTYFAGMEKVTMLLTAVFLFVGFKNLNIKFSKVINVIAASTFGVYLIHDNSYVRTFLWINLFKNAHHYEHPFFVLQAIGAIVSVYIVCTMIDIIYRYVIEEKIWKILLFFKRRVLDKIIG